MVLQLLIQLMVHLQVRTPLEQVHLQLALLVFQPLEQLSQALVVQLVQH